MKKVTFILTVLVFGLWACHSIAPTSDVNDTKVEQNNTTSLIPQKALTNKKIDNTTHPLHEKINRFLNQKTPRKFEPLPYNKEDYLKIIDKQVRAMLKYQNEDGRIIDPVEKKEKYYTTPCFAHSVSVLVASSYIKKEDALAINGMKALDVSLTDMVNATVNGNHGDFYTWPVMLAYQLFKPYANTAQLKSWDEKIQAIEIDKLYAMYNLSRGSNWILVHSAGEFLRAANGFTNFDYVEKMLDIQLRNFTKLGMYNEGGNPLPYDLFPRHYLSGMLQMGYEGKHLVKMQDNLWKGAWTSIFMQSPFGELPTGYRSSHHIWNEAEQCVVFEIYATAYQKAGRKKEAGIFKRAAMLSLSSMYQWIREDGSGYIVKNRFPIENKHGYERYSVHTCYNMLATSMLAQAWQFSDDAIKEQPAPADMGGFVLPILDPYHKVFANANGTYLEYETQGDGKYNPTGLVRAHIKGANPQLGPSNGLAPFISGEGINIATGPSWQTPEGKWISLAGLKLKNPTVETLSESPTVVKFRLTYDVSDTTNQQGASIVETFLIEDGTITVTEEFKGLLGKKRITWPMLISDGKEQVQSEINNTIITLTLRGKGINFEVLTPEKVNIGVVVPETSYKHINGLAKVAYITFPGNQITYRLKAKS